MRAFALTCEALSHLDSTEGKVQCAAAYLSGCEAADVGVAARFLAGSPLPPGARAPKVGAATIVKLVAERCGTTPAALRRAARSKGDLGIAVAASLARLDDTSPEGAPDLQEIAGTLVELGAHGAESRNRRLRLLLDRVDPIEAKYLTKLLVGGLRTGMQAARVEEAIALAFRRPLEGVRRAHMLLGDIGAVAERARAGPLDDVRLRVFRPVRCMLARPVEDDAEVVDALSLPLIAEDKLDGVRAQLHVDGRTHKVFSRRLEDLTHLFPELGDGLAHLADDWILDGEIVAWRDGPLPFAQLQQRLGRRQVPLTMLLDVPVVCFVFDVLRAAGRDLIDEPLDVRKAQLEALPTHGAVRAATFETIDRRARLPGIYERALDNGHEGVVYKDPASPYRPGVRGGAWLKLKRPLATLDVVVTAAEYGSGKRAGWLSDLTFAVRGPDGLVDVGKAYSGLTDAEIVGLTEHFKTTTVARRGGRHEVDPSLCLEVAFGGVQRSSRHPSGFALRFPRIVRQRTDLSPDDIDDVDRVEELYRGQAGRPTSTAD